MRSGIKRAAHVFPGTLLLSALVPLGLGVSAGAASAASCSGYSCHGLDPSNRCTDTKHKAVNATDTSDPLAPETVAILNNRYAGGCHSNWAQAVLTPEGYADGDSMIVLIETNDSRGNFESMCYPGPGNTGSLNEYCYQTNYRGTAAAYTDMVDGTNVASAYVYVYASNGALIASAESDQ